MQDLLEAPVQEAPPVGTRPSLHPLSPHPQRRSPSRSLAPLQKVQQESLEAINWFFNFLR